MQWQQIIEFLGGATAISLIIGYLGKAIIDAFLKGRIESYKNNLERIASEHAIRFQSLHTARAEIIQEFYEKLALLDDTLYSTLRPFQAVGEPAPEEKVKLLSIQFNELREYFLPKRIFFDDNICKLIDKILESAKGVFFDITTYPVDIKDTQYKYNRDMLTHFPRILIRTFRDFYLSIDLFSQVLFFSSDHVKSSQLCVAPHKGDNFQSW